jgi:hypothetical protein
MEEGAHKLSKLFGAPVERKVFPEDEDRKEEEREVESSGQNVFFFPTEKKTQLPQRFSFFSSLTMSAATSPVVKPRFVIPQFLLSLSKQKGLPLFHFPREPCDSRGGIFRIVNPFPICRPPPSLQRRQEDGRKENRKRGNSMQILFQEEEGGGGLT